MPVCLLLSSVVALCGVYCLRCSLMLARWRFAACQRKAKVTPTCGAQADPRLLVRQSACTCLPYPLPSPLCDLQTGGDGPRRLEGMRHRTPEGANTPPASDDEQVSSCYHVL